MMRPADALRGPWQRRLASAARGLSAGIRGRTGDTVWALLEQGAGLVASTLTFLLLGRSLGATGFGAYVGLYALVGPFLAPSVSGVSLAAMEHIVRNREDPVDVVRSCMSVTGLFAIAWAPLLSVASILWIEGLPAAVAILLISAEFCLNGLLSLFVGVEQAVTGFSAAARLRILGTLSRIALLAALAAAGALTLTNLAVGQIATLGAVVVLGVARISRRIGAPARPGRLRARHLRSTLLYGVGIGASSAQGDGDKFVLNAAHHQADAGRYGAAYRLMGIVLLPVNAVVRMTHVSFLDAARGGETQLRRALRLSLFTFAYAVVAIAALVLLAPLVPVLLTRDFDETSRILQLLAPVVILRGIGVFPMNGLMGLGLNRLRTTLLVANAVFSLVLYAALIPGYSWRGALVATFASELSLCVSGWVALVVCERGGRAAPEAAEPRP